MCAASGSQEGFLRQLAEAIRPHGGPAYDERRARALAEAVWRDLGSRAPDDFPHMVQEEDLRFVCQWDEEPPIMTVMLWDGEMWRDMERLVLPTAPPAREGE
ncbi:MAG: hypothetical protein LOD90_10885 [Symbiobacteriaceae bacterium]